jgi:prophage regulatory protein
MTEPIETTGDRLAGRDRAPVEPALLNVRAVAEMICCAPRTIYRLADAGQLPQPVRVGGLVRWRRADVNDWLAAGCPVVRAVAKGGRR